jgi:hypothetical protein
VKKSDGACAGSLALAITQDGTDKELDPFVAARLERSRTAQTLTDANKLFEAGRVGEARAKLATRQEDLKKNSDVALALAAAQPQTAAPRRASKALDRDFGDQAAAIAQAEQQFAPPPPAATATASPAASGVVGGFAKAPPARPASPSTREGKAQVRSNQERASEFGF